MTTSVTLGTQAIGAAGELLVQYQLLKQGIVSARLTTDSGIDLVMYVPGHESAATVQVKTRLKPVPAGGKGKVLLSWPFPGDSPAQWLACVDLSTDSVWILPIDTARELAQQKHPDGTRLLYFYTDESIGTKALRASDMACHRLESVVATLLAGTIGGTAVTTIDPRYRQKAALDRKIKACRKCTDLNEPGVTESAPGFGSIDSPVAIVGEALCRACMKEQEPFYGGSGRVLDRCFERAGVGKAELFITNSIHCHPPGDRDPHPHETKNCSAFLRAELHVIVQPRLVIGVGKFAKAAVVSLYPEARELNCPFRVPRARRNDPPDQRYLLFPQHPYYIMTRAAPVREQYERCLARAIAWGFTLDKPVRAATR